VARKPEPKHHFKSRRQPEMLILTRRRPEAPDTLNPPRKRHPEAPDTLNPPRKRHPEAPRFYQRGEGSRADLLCTVASRRTPHARSLARLKNAVLRDDASRRVSHDEREEKPA
jgi:hypothetical protein